MQLKELSLNNFRNYVKLELKFNSNLVVFFGRNAQGKTNILESIFLSCTGRSHRTSKDKELILWGKDRASVKILCSKEEGDSLIELFLHSKDRKKIHINGIPAQRLGELMGHLNSVLFSPEDLKLVKGGPGERRRFIDMEISQVRPRYFYSLQQYNRILKQRNNLLKEIQQNSSLRKTLPIWNEQLAKVSAYIMLQRKFFIDSLYHISKQIHREISAGSEELEVWYNPSISFDTEDMNKIAEIFLETLQKNEEEDIKRGSTSKGCHRDDMQININGVDLKTFGSQGQQRTAVLSLKLSEIELMYRETGEYPILLLDDVMSELDNFRQKMLLSYLDRVQTFITTTELINLPGINMQNVELYEINKGTASKCCGKQP